MSWENLPAHFESCLSFQTRSEPGNVEANIGLDSKLPRRCPWQFLGSVTYSDIVLHFFPGPTSLVQKEASTLPGRVRDLHWFPQGMFWKEKQRREEKKLWKNKTRHPERCLLLVHLHPSATSETQSCREMVLHDW